MLFNKKSVFPKFILFSALGLASVAAYFSIIGISTLFAGAAISVGILALFLEFGKIAAISFAYRYWDKCKSFLKLYLVASIIVLSIITSAGIAGMLMSAFQKSSIEFTITQEKITAIQDQKTYYHDKIDASKKRIEDLTTLRTSEEFRMSQVLTNEYITRNLVQLKQLQQQNVDLINDTDNSIKNENSKIQDSIDGVAKIDSQINDLKMGTAEKKDVQTFKFVADALKLPLDVVARWFILSIICVFDPLAICLILAYNVVVYKKEDEIIYDKNIPTIPTITPKIEESTAPPPTSTIVSPIITSNTSIEKVEEKSIPKKTEMSDFFRQMFKSE